MALSEGHIISRRNLLKYAVVGGGSAAAALLLNRLGNRPSSTQAPDTGSAGILKTPAPDTTQELSLSNIPQEKLYNAIVSTTQTDKFSSLPSGFFYYGESPNGQVNSPDLGSAYEVSLYFGPNRSQNSVQGISTYTLLSQGTLAEKGQDKVKNKLSPVHAAVDKSIPANTVIGFDKNQYVISSVVDNVLITTSYIDQASLINLQAAAIKHLRDAATTAPGTSTAMSTPTKTETPDTTQQITTAERNGSKLFNSTIDNYSEMVPTDWKYTYQTIGQPKDIFLEPSNKGRSMTTYSTTLRNPSATVNDWLLISNADIESHGFTATSLPGKPAGVSDSLLQDLLEVAKIKMDGKDTKVVFVLPGKDAFIKEVSIRAYMVDKGKAWTIATAFDFGIATPNVLEMSDSINKLKVAMKTFHVTGK